MPPVQRSMRANLHDYKSKFVKILGQAKETQYWQLLSSFLSYKLSKAELDKQVLSTIGKENVVLHNQLLRAIFSNALCNEAPPPPSSFVHDISKPVKGIRRKPLNPASLSNEEPGPGSPVPAIRTNGDGAIPSSPKKGRSALRDRKAKERPSPLGFHHRGEASTSQGGSADEETPRSLENGGLKTPDMSRPVQQSPYPAEHSNLELSSPVPPAAKRPRLGVTGSGGVLLGDGKAGTGYGNREMDVDDVEENEEDEEIDEDILDMPNGFIKPPMGCTASYGGPRVEKFVSKFPPPPVTQTLLGDKLEDEILDGDCLPDTERLHRSMQLMAVERGLEDVNLETARCVNKALDVYLKAVIQPLIELVRARRSGNLGTREMQTSPKENGGIFGKEARKDNSVHLQKQLNGSWSDHIPSRDGTVLSGEGPCDDPGKHRPRINSLDLKVAMDLNPKVLGEDWPTHLEKISFRAFDP